MLNSARYVRNDADEERLQSILITWISSFLLMSRLRFVKQVTKENRDQSAMIDRDYFFELMYVATMGSVNPLYHNADA